MKYGRRVFDWSLVFILIFFSQLVWAQRTASKPTATKPANVIFILADDHRYDFMGFTGKVPGLQTPNMDRLAKEGAHLQNAYVSTALCSPSRASILTGQYAHTHTIVDNQAPLPKGLTFFPQYLQEAGYKTAFFGKWHMGNTEDEPQPGFNHWESFRGQGVYYNPTLNINGRQVAYKDSTYISDLLTQHAIDWMKQHDKQQPFFLYLSHKGVHAEFEPAQRHRGRYKNMPIHYPASMFLTASDTSNTWPLRNKIAVNPEIKTEVNLAGIPEWVKKQRYSWHGVDYMYHGRINFDDFYRRYCETLLGIDESIGQVLDYLKKAGLDKNTLVIYMGDNGFSFGEHGLIDKRHAYEESMRVPLLMRYPEVIKPGTKITQVIQNIDIAPTILAVAGKVTPSQMQGKSFLPLLQGRQIPWRDKAFYEYYWEYDFPQTPTVFAVRSGRYKYIRYHGIWDTNELFDLQNDPQEVNNLIAKPEHQPLVKQLAGELYDWLESTGGMQVPLKRTIKMRDGDYLHPNQY
ncbi:acetylglucosamine-6-sulfatase [Adhaeribacter arboris]|uniref:Acetylglucosamine-6-sulfatase n=1 Tax=Adhaeribacter arboris TaxID=2072846 RepID=A0A2T2YAG3_9BACT|nr:sulfatase [Adhaeribacter arboris]PSR52505.1 acetylglucosamine-6-sulfatase [Adhaeribacter arboris]